MGDNPINGKNGMWQTMVFALVPRDGVTAARLLEKRQLPPDRYQARLHVDRDNRLARDRDYELGKSDLLGTVEFDGPWRPGYQPPKIFAAPKK